MRQRVLMYAGLLLILTAVRFFPQLNPLPYIYMVIPLLFRSDEELGFRNYRKGLLYGSLFLPLFLIAPPDLSCGVWVLNQLGVATAEEIFFRGYLQPAVGNVRTSLLFSLAHLINFPTVNSLLIFFPSLILGTVYLRSGSILAPILLHFSANLFYSSFAEEFPELYRFLQRKLTGS